MERPVAQIVERVQPGYYVEHKLPNPLVSERFGGIALRRPRPLRAPSAKASRSDSG